MEDAQEVSPDAKKSATSGFWQKTTTIQKVLLILAVLFPFYIASTTKLVPNYSCLNQTINGTLYTDCGVLYDYGDYIPKSFMSNGQAAIEAIIILALFFSLYTSRTSGRIPISDAVRMLKAELKKIQLLPTIDGEFISIRGKEIELPTGVITRYRTEHKEWKPFRYTIGMKVTDRVNGIEHYYKGMFHPMTGYFDGFVPTDKDIKDWDMCSKCGQEYDVSTFTEEDVKRFFEMRRGMGAK